MTGFEFFLLGIAAGFLACLGLVVYEAEQIRPRVPPSSRSLHRTTTKERLWKMALTRHQ